MLLKEYIFRDPIHGDISVSDPTILGLINAPEFQRLRRIRQLGTSFISYPGAEHTRFAHSLGVYHLARRLLRHLCERGRAEMSVDEQVLVCCAALLHDIGHGPFSHLFEKLTGTRHEEWAQRIILSSGTQVHQALAAREATWPEAVARLLGTAAQQPLFVRDLLSSQLDVDRMDYLLRDATMCGVSYGRFDLDRLIDCLTVFNGRLVVHSKGQSAAEAFSLARYFMYWNVYFHKATRSSEALLDRLLQRAADLYSAGAAQALGKYPPQLKPLLARSAPNLSEYLGLDEVDVLYGIKTWVHSPDPVLADLADRFIHRRLFSGILLRGPLPDPVYAVVQEAVASAGFTPPEYYMAVDRTANVTYTPYTRNGEMAAQPIYVLDDVAGPTRLEELSRRSKVLQGVTEESISRYVLFVPKEVGGGLRSLLNPQLHLEV